VKSLQDELVNKSLNPPILVVNEQVFSPLRR
jgi:hypothetical protein